MLVWKCPHSGISQVPHKRTLWVPNLLIILSNLVTSKEVSVEVLERYDEDDKELVIKVKVKLLLIVVRKKVVSKSHENDFLLEILKKSRL